MWSAVSYCATGGVRCLQPLDGSGIPCLPARAGPSGLVERSREGTLSVPLRDASSRTPGHSRTRCRRPLGTFGHRGGADAQKKSETNADKLL